ncbi:DUF6575 domain-containing protein [Desulfosporosinus metallidurans]|uniref:DUF6575 domain-containing protein n=1 Tax=Desulfosporosinus metallidurans TaxID=1888891 RepID=A0A1Q8QF60_9FIRM|nr:DUF6575 domain-containing protein [Desulfosporosinus metallidurans]OLN25951.1 hypothetical protein DSOL_5167 [Desulfosporosinus metallidurans]
MLREFLKVDVLGTLYVDEIFFFYEEPQIFTCMSRARHKYLALLTDMDCGKWMLLPISEAQLSLLKSNRLSLKEAFINPEDEFIWQLELSQDSTIAKAKQIFDPQVLSDDLPDDDVYLDYEADPLMPVVKDDILEIAKKERRDIIDLALVTNNHSREIECDILGEVLSTTQQILYTLPMPRESLRGRIPKDIRDRNTAVVAGTLAASFGVRFKSPGLCDLFGETDLSQTLKMFLDLLNSKDDDNKLREILHNHSKKTVFKYRQLMKVLLQAKTGLKIKAASPNNYRFEISFSMDDIERSIQLLETEIKDMVYVEKMFGTMVGINVDKQTFAFKSIEDENIIGKLSENFNGVTFEVPKYVQAEIQQRITLNEITKEERYVYTLLAINVDVKVKEGEDIEIT